MRPLIVVLAACTGTLGQAQPYLDVLNVAGLASPWRLGRLDVNANLPIKLNERDDRLVVSPGFERWQVGDFKAALPPACATNDGLLGYALPVTYLRSLVPDQWKLSVTGIGRYMLITDSLRGDVQLGGAFLVQRVKGPKLTWKFGAYANADAFGLFMLPLLGIDWRIDAKHNLFGVLPGNMIYEHKVVPWFHWGVAYKAITTSFGTRDGDFRRVDENTVGLFAADLHPGSNIVFRAEAGGTVLSEYRGGELDPCYALHGEDGYVDHALGDGVYFKVMLAYRVRLDEEKTTPGE